VKKDTLVFVHGAWHGKWCWEKYFAPKFRDRGYEVVTFDLPGHDQFGKIKGINKYRLSDYTEALQKEVAKLDSEPILIGHSMGGLVVQKYLENHTCKKVVLLASVPPSGAIQATLRFMKKGYFYSSLLRLNLYGLVNSPEKCRHAFFSPQLPNEQLQEYTNHLCSESFLAFLDMLMPKVQIKRQPEIPTLVIGAINIMMDSIAHDMMLDVNHTKVSDIILGWLEK